jgi:hypothetical protein
VAATAGSCYRTPAVVATDPPHRAVRDLDARGADLVGEEPVAELEVVTMRVEHGVREPGLVEFSVGERLAEPPAVLLATELEDPAGHRDGDAVNGQFTDEPERQFGEMFAWDRYPAARRRTSFSCSSIRIRRFASRSSASSVVVGPGGSRRHGQRDSSSSSGTTR